MSNPFLGRMPSLNGPGQDIVPVIPSDTEDFAQVATALYIENGGVLSIVTAAGNTRKVAVGDLCIFPVGVKRVNATDTTATGLHALMVL
ncbi:spike base protein, RCAP_Rcc01079 family [Celeribacter sp.]|uniref:spike base protein, RCAP_Rcc01079 family n=1 Tax=Celeribacter sp. TaxID=1890673 RepID=UPI003A936BFA